jgi:hypothetical protein
VTKQAEATRFVHFSFKQKMERIDYYYLTWHNILRVFEKYEGGEPWTKEDLADRDEYLVMFKSMMQIT